MPRPRPRVSPAAVSTRLISHELPPRRGAIYLPTYIHGCFPPKVVRPVGIRQYFKRGPPDHPRPHNNFFACPSLPLPFLSSIDGGEAQADLRPVPFVCPFPALGPAPLATDRWHSSRAFIHFTRSSHLFITYTGPSRSGAGLVLLLLLLLLSRPPASSSGLILVLVVMSPV